MLEKVFKHRSLSTLPNSLVGAEREKAARLGGVAEIALLRLAMGITGGEGEEGAEDGGDEDEGDLEAGEGDGDEDEEEEEEEERVSDGVTVSYLLNGRECTKEDLDTESRYPTK